MNLMNKKDGITLLVLIITIIVLLILAGVGIATFTKNNSIIQNSNKSVKNYKLEKIKEEINLEQMNKMVEEHRYLNNIEMAEILKSYGEIERDKIKIGNELIPVEELLGDYSNKKLSKYVIAGYWENYVDEMPLKLSQVFSEYEVINIAFARNASSNDGTLTFNLNEYLCTQIDYSKEEFINDVKKLQEQGKKILISVGGSSGGNFKITTDEEANNFASSLSTIIDEYNFNGADIDIESGEINEEAFKKAIMLLSDKYASNIMITINSNLTNMRSADVNGGKDNLWYKISADLKDLISITSSRYYNSGTQRGYDYNEVYSREQGHISFITSIAIKQLEDKKLANNNIGITILGFNAKQEASLPQAYLTPSEIVETLKSIIEGKNLNLEYKNFIPSRPYPEIKAVTIWSINKDAYHNNEMSKAISEYLKLQV